jgi:hypothetical protein
MEARPPSRIFTFTAWRIRSSALNRAAYRFATATWPSTAALRRTRRRRQISAARTFALRTRVARKGIPCAGVRTAGITIPRRRIKAKARAGSLVRPGPSSANSRRMNRQARQEAGAADRNFVSWRLGRFVPPLLQPHAGSPHAARVYRSTFVTRATAAHPCRPAAGRARCKDSRDPPLAGAASCYATLRRQLSARPVIRRPSFAPPDDRRPSVVRKATRNSPPSGSPLPER